MTDVKRPRIAFLLSSLKFGGAERVALNLAHALKGQGYEIDFVLMQAEGELLDEAARNFNTVDLHCSRTWKLPGRLARYLARTRPVGLVSSFWKLNLCACVARVFVMGTRLALWEHSPPSRSRNSPIWLYFLTASLFYRLATCVVAVSRGVADDVRATTVGLGPKIVTIFNAVPGPYHRAAARPQNPARRIIWVGRFAEPKNPELIIEAFARLPAARGYVLTMLGDGPLRPELEERSSRLGLGERVRFLGFQSDVYAHMAQADLLVSTSDREGLPTVLIEALHAGIGVVATDSGLAVREILLDGTYGTIVPVNDAVALAGAIVQELAGSRNCDTQRRGAMRFDPALVAREFVQAMGFGGALDPRASLAEMDGGLGS